MLMDKGREGNKSHNNVFGPNAPKENRLYSFQTHCKQKYSPYVVTDILKIFQLDVYALHDLDDTLSLLKPYVARRFKILPNEFVSSFLLSLLLLVIYSG